MGGSQRDVMGVLEQCDRVQERHPEGHTVGANICCKHGGQLLILALEP